MAVSVASFSRVLTNLEEGSQGERLPSILADSIWITARVSAYQPQLTTLSAGSRLRAGIARWSNGTGYSEVHQLSFLTPEQGWVIQDSGYEGAVLMRVRDGDFALNHGWRRDLDRRHARR
jgi:hypothetical protein